VSPRTLKADLVVIGAGSGGLSVAAGAAQLGLKVVLFEKGEMGGDCLNYGCVPSKALIAAADKAHQARSPTLGVASSEVTIDFAAVMAHVHRTIATIAPVDSQERFEGLGVHVVRAAARFVDGRTVVGGDVRVRARKIVIATGSRAVVPPIPGLEATPYLTNETVFELTERPRRLIVLGGGPIGVELGQAFRRLGSEVVIVEAAAILGREDPQAAQVVLDQLRSDGVELRAGTRAVRVDAGGSGSGLVLTVEGPDGESRIEGSHLLVAVGRESSIAGLDLDKAGIEHDARGIRTDRSLRSTNRRVYAVGDVAGRGQFTHLAGAHASLFVRRAIFAAPVNADTLAVPRVTYCDPELAAIGLGEAEAIEAHGDDVRTVVFHLAENDRAQAEGDTRGFGKLITTKKGKVLGVTLVGRHSGDQILLWALVLSSRLKLSALTGMIAPYPTRSEIGKRLAGMWYTPALFSDRTRKLVSFLKHLA
jgi:pyruvate/2-oxoglutarate dehydrogenase complex dihydrolipoamide dehydrogenase (E3) component